MKRITLSLIVMFAVIALVQEDASAWRLFRRRTTTTTSCPNGQCRPASLSGNDQQRCQQKAQIMASRRVMSHGVAPIVGTFEGIGMGSSRNCGTCTPRRGMTLTGDGAAQASNGTWYRCRSWR